MVDVLEKSKHLISPERLQRLGEFVDVFYDKIGKHHQSVSGRVAHGAAPPADAFESETGLQVLMELPGMKKDDIEILVGEDRLTVRGEKSSDRQEQAEGYLIRECFTGKFSRTFLLSDDLDAERIQAKFANGLLTITVPRKQGSKGPMKKVEIADG